MFIDEGGNFDFSTNGKKHFTLSCLTEKRPVPSYGKRRNIKYDLIEDGMQINKKAKRIETNKLKSIRPFRLKKSLQF